MIYTIHDFLLPVSPTTTLNGVTVCAVPLPFYEGLLGRISSAWEVLTGRAVAARYPRLGEFEVALCDVSGAPCPDAFRKAVMAQPITRVSI